MARESCQTYTRAPTVSRLPNFRSQLCNAHLSSTRQPVETGRDIEEEKRHRWKTQAVGGWLPNRFTASKACILFPSVYADALCSSPHSLPPKSHRHCSEYQAKTIIHRSTTLLWRFVPPAIPSAGTKAPSKFNPILVARYRFVLPRQKKSAATADQPPLLCTHREACRLRSPAAKKRSLPRSSAAIPRHSN